MKLLWMIPILILAGCELSNAGSGVSKAEVDAIVADAVAPLQSEIDSLNAQVAGLEEQVVNRFIAGSPNPVQIAPLYPIYFEGLNCEGNAYLPGGNTVSSVAVKQGIAFRYTLPGQEREAPETYAWVEPGIEFVQTETNSILHAAGNCSNETNITTGYPTQQQTDPEAYELLTGVPAGGYLEGTTLSSFSAVRGDGLIGADFYDMPTSTGFFVRFDARSEPITLE